MELAREAYKVTINCNDVTWQLNAETGVWEVGYGRYDYWLDVWAMSPLLMTFILEHKDRLDGREFYIGPKSKLYVMVSYPDRLWYGTIDTGPLWWISRGAILRLMVATDTYLLGGVPDGAA